jgi:DNA-binding CsgD family transcriptional regulator
MSKFELYGLFCPFTDEIKYIGITINGLNKRLRDHLRKPTNKYISSWFEELKENNLKPIIRCIKECQTYDELLKCEITEIKKYRGLNFDLYNISDGGDINPMFGKTHTTESRLKISLTHKGRKMSEEQKLKRSLLLKELWSNPEWSKKVRQKMGYNTKGDKNPNWKGGISVSHCECGDVKSNKSKTCISCRDITGNKNPFYGKTHSPEIISKIQQKLKDKGGFSGKNNPNFKYDINKEELIELYIKENKTIKGISDIYNCSINTINKKLRLYNINKPKSNVYNLNKDKIIYWLTQGLNYVQIGEKYGCSNKIIYKYIKTHNLYVK